MACMDATLVAYRSLGGRSLSRGDEERRAPVLQIEAHRVATSLGLVRSLIDMTSFRDSQRKKNTAIETL